jgi:multiple sugar transport system permease protein
MRLRAQSGLEWGRNRQGYLYVLPWLIGFLVFQLYPIITSFYISLLKWDGIGERVFVGLRNYIAYIWPADLTTIRHVLFMRAVRNNALFMLFAVVGGNVLALLMAAVMNDKVPGHRPFRVIFFLPSLVIPVSFGLLMVPIFMGGTEGGSQTGLLNVLITMLGGKPVNWLGNPRNAIWILIITNFWYVGATMIIFMAGIAGVPKSYYEAAELDGAGWWTRFLRVTVPLLTPIITFQAIQGLIYGLRIFDLAASLARMADTTSNLMGTNNSLATLVFYLYRKGWGDWKMGESAALGWIVFIIGFILTLFIVTYLRRRGRAEAGEAEKV